MDKFPHTLGHKALLTYLREVREAAGVTQVELAEKIGETQSFVSKCERGERRLDLIELREWCLALDHPFIDFVEGLEERLAPRPKRPRTS
jgi:transcriptional regulator with XRE-family HTH domain